MQVLYTDYLQLVATLQVHQGAFPQMNLWHQVSPRSMLLNRFWTLLMDFEIIVAFCGCLGGLPLVTAKDTKNLVPWIAWTARKAKVQADALY